MEGKEGKKGMEGGKGRKEEGKKRGREKEEGKEWREGKEERREGIEGREREKEEGKEWRERKGERGKNKIKNEHHGFLQQDERSRDAIGVGWRCTDDLDSFASNNEGNVANFQKDRRE